MSFLSRIAAYYISQSGTDMSRYIFVFSNRRAGLFFRKELAARLNGAVFAPQTITINECLAHFSKLRSADQLTLLLALYEEYVRLITHQSAHSQPESFDDFLFKGRTILSDFSEADNHLIGNIEALFRNISDLKEIDAGFSFLSDEQRQWLRRFWSDYFLSVEKKHPSDDKTDFHTPFVRTWSILSPLYTAFKKRLTTEEIGYEGLIHRDAIERLESGEATITDRQRYVFIGFNALSTSERRLMLIMKRQGRADFFFDYESPFLSDPACRASLFMKQNFDDFGQPPFSEPQQARNFQLPQTTMIQVPSDVAETFEVHRILKENNIGDSNDLTKTAVVLPDERLLLPMLRSIPQNIPVVNISMGYPLAATSLWALIENLFRLQSSARNGAFYYRDVLAILRHPLMAEQLIRDGGDALKDLIIRGKWLFIATTTIYKLQSQKEDSKGLLKLVFRMADNAPQMIDYLSDILCFLSDEGMSNDESLFLLQTTLNRLHNTFLSHPETLPNMHTDTLFSVFRILLADSTIPFVGEPLQGLQVMGVLETRALSFDNVIITCFNDELYPGHTQPETFIPYSIRRAFSLPLPERQDAIFAYNFYHLFSSAKRVWFISNSVADDRRTGEPSRFLNQLKYQYNIPIEQQQVVFLPHTADENNEAIEKTNDDVQRLFNTGLSPSAINTYFRCQKLFYFQYVLGLRYEEEPGSDIAPNDFGTWFHGVMENLYQPYLNTCLTPETIQHIQKHLHELIIQMPHLDAVRSDRLLIKVLEQYAYYMLALDIKNAPFTIMGLEKKCSRELLLPTDKTIKLTGTIDRIDKLSDGRIKVIDYKTGNSKNTYKSIDELFSIESDNHNGYALQTMLYCYFYEQYDNQCIIEPHLYNIRNVAADDSNIDTLVHDYDSNLFDWRNIRTEYLSRLATLIDEEILNTDKPFAKIAKKNREKVCSNCAFRSLCDLTMRR